MKLGSSDGSAALPEIQDPELVVTAVHIPPVPAAQQARRSPKTAAAAGSHHAAGPALELPWQWEYTVGCAAGRQPMVSDGSGYRDGHFESQLLTKVTEILAPFPDAVREPFPHAPSMYPGSNEAQFVKNHLTKASQLARSFPAPFKLAITGTPMENNLMELWSLFAITAPGLFPSPSNFTDYYRKPVEKDGDAGKLKQLRRRIRPLIMRRTKDAVAKELPPKQEQEQVLELELAPRHRTIYQRHLQRERQKVLGLLGDMDKNRFAIFKSLTTLRMLSLDASLVDPKYASAPSSKLDVLFEQLEDVVAEGHRALIFSQFTSFLGKARERLDAAGIEYAYLDGKTRKRGEVIDKFKSGTAPVFLISLKPGGFGLNLTEADYCFLLDPWWNPATENQAVDRKHRIGQTKNVMVYRLVAKDTIEEKVMALKEKKAKLFSSVMDDDAMFSSAITADDVRGLFDV